MPDLILENARVHTLDAARPHAQAVAISGGRVTAVGSLDEVSRSGEGLGLGLGRRQGRGRAGKGRGAVEKIDLGGATVVPGFDDTHVHIWKMGHLLTGMLDLRSVTSIRDLAGALRRHATHLGPGEWLLGRGYNEACMEGGRGPVRTDLDAAVGPRPVLLTRTCGHIAVASSAALALAEVGPDTPDPPGGSIERDDRGGATGVLNETAMGLVSRHVPEPSQGQLEAMVLAGARQLIALGVTAATEAGITPQQLAAYRSLDARGALPLRVHAMALRRPLGDTRIFPLPERFVSPFLRVDSIKLVADGGLSGATAALWVPYRHKDDRGLLRLSADEIVELGRDAHDAGLRIGIHAIGDRAIDACLDAFERLRASDPGPGPGSGAGPARASGRGGGRGPGSGSGSGRDSVAVSGSDSAADSGRRQCPRHRIEHFGLPDAGRIARAARLGLVATVQPIFIHDLGANFRRYLPDGLLGRCYPVRAMLDASLCVAFSSDAPVVADAAPLLGIRAALTRRDAQGQTIAPEQAVTADEALRAYTLGGAEATGEETQRGSITPGKWADLAVLSEDPLETAPEDLGRVNVTMTIVGGAIAYRR